MNIQQLFSLKASLIASRVRLADAIEEVQHAINEALAPDAGLVVVSRPYCMWMSVTDYGLFCEWDYRWMVADGWRYTGCRVVFAASGWMSHEVNISPSYLTIADARGEGEVGVDCRTNRWDAVLPHEAGPIIGPLGCAWWTQWPYRPDALFYNHTINGDPPRMWKWWHPDESTVLDCAAVPHAMTWRPA